MSTETKASLRGVRGRGALLIGIVAKEASSRGRLSKHGLHPRSPEGLLVSESESRESLGSTSRVEGTDFRSAMLSDARFENTQLANAISDTPPMPEHPRSVMAQPLVAAAGQARRARAKSW